MRMPHLELASWPLGAASPGGFLHAGGTMSNRKGFWGRVLKTEGCWIWQGPTNRDGYGHTSVPGRRGVARAHRFAYEKEVGPIPPRMLVLHSCDNPSCVRPDHLFLGTQADNIKDKCDKGRQANGERQHLAKLTANDVLLIRAAHATGKASLGVLAKQHGVTKQAIWHVVHRKTWKHM